MKRILLSAVAAAVLSVTSAFAADMPVKAKPPMPEPSPWDWAFGGALMSDYNFRGISQSAKGSSGTVYSETRYNATSNFQLYFGQQTWAVALPTRPSCECDIYAGIRPTVGPLSFDLGAIYYWYPKEQQQFIDPTGTLVTSALRPGGTILTLRDSDFWEVYGKVTWDVVKDKFAVGANVYYSPSWLKTGAGGTYASITAKFTGPEFKVGLFGIDSLGWFISGEVGRYWLGTADKFVPFFAPFDLPDYTTWNVGLAFTYKVFTFDVRYYDTDLSKANCFVLTGDPRGIINGNVQSSWCGSTVIAAMKFDLTAMTNLK
jgi:uncharacterized protein (TIGR02001 family)